MCPQQSNRRERYFMNILLYSDTLPPSYLAYLLVRQINCTQNSGLDSWIAELVSITKTFPFRRLDHRLRMHTCVLSIIGGIWVGYIELIN